MKERRNKKRKATSHHLATASQHSELCDRAHRAMLAFYSIMLVKIAWEALSKFL